MSNEKEQSIFEKMGGKYIKVGDYYVPDFGEFDDNKEEMDDRQLGKYGHMRATFLKEHRKQVYIDLYMRGMLNKHLYEVDEECFEQIERIVDRMKGKYGVTEELKGNNQMEWVGLMNNLHHMAEEVVLRECVFN